MQSIRSKISILSYARLLVLMLLPFSALGQEMLSEGNTASEVIRINALLNSARQAMENNDIDASMHAYETLLRIEPDHPEALYQLGILKFKKGDSAEGMELIKRAVMVAPENPLPRLTLARALGEAGKDAEAIQEYEKLLVIVEPGSSQADTILLEQNMLEFKLATRNKDRHKLQEYGKRIIESPATNPKGLNIVGTVYSRAGMFEESRIAYEKLLELVPGDSAAELALGGIYERLRQPVKAITHYELAAKNADNPDLARSAKVRLGLLRAFSFLAENDQENAQIQFMAVLDLDENNVIANMNAAGYLHRHNELEKARQLYHKVTLIQPDNMDAHYGLAIVYLDMSDALNGVRELDYILAMEPDGVVARAARETLKKMTKKWDLNAIRDVLVQETALQESLKKNPDDPSLMVALGALMMSQRRPDEAFKYFEAALAADSSYGDAYYKLGLYYEETHQLEQAASAYQSALKLIDDPGVQVEIENRLLMVSANLNMKNKEFDEAEEKLLEASKRMPLDAKVFWGLAMVNTQQGDIEEAVKWYLKVIELYPNHVQARLNLARAYESLEDEDNAIVQYRAVSMSDNVTPEMKMEANRRIDYLQRQINGFFYLVGYSIGMNDNLNSAREQKYFDYRSDLFASVNYKYKLKKGMKFSLNVTPSYSIYHRSEYDFFNFSVMPGLLVNKWGYDWNFGLSRNTESSVLRTEQSSTVTETLNAGVSWQDKNNEGYDVSMSYRGFASIQNPFLDSDMINMGINLNQSGPENTYLSYGYSLTLNKNTNTLGNDYAYNGHSINGRIDKRIDGRLSGYINGSMILNLYQNADSSTNFQRNRRTFGIGAGCGLNYRLDTWASLYAGFYHFTQYSTLPVSFTFNELQVVESRQSASLGSFNSNMINTGLRMNF